ncbi:MAG TPA: toll/interleukin-1 receptor domain-containing protein [Pyrinomonadaceae bacterium]
MANEEHLKILKQGTRVWNRWREDNTEIEPDLSLITLKGLDLKEVNLSGAKLNGSYLLHCNLDNVDLNFVVMRSITLINTSLIETNFSKSSFPFANFFYCDLKKAIMAHARIERVNFCDSTLNDTDFSYGIMYGNSFSNVDLSSAKGLENVEHHRPSTIGIDTLYKSAGNIPEIFLRGCGVPDDFITHISSIIGMQQAIQFYSCFISYSTKDEEFARKLHSRMRQENLRVWFAPEDIKGGEKLFEQIERAIQIHDRLLIILSEESMQSEWVMSEIRRARKTEVEQKRRKLFPIRLVDFEAIKNWERIDADSGMDIAAEVRSYYIPDFSDWKNHDSFEKGFARLLKDLRDEETRQSEKAESGKR